MFRGPTGHRWPSHPVNRRSPQGNASQCFFEEGSIVAGLAGALSPRNGNEIKPLSDCAVTTEIVNLDLVPTGIELATFDRQQPLEAMTALRRAIVRLSVQSDVCQNSRHLIPIKPQLLHTSTSIETVDKNLKRSAKRS